MRYPIINLISETPVEFLQELVLRDGITFFGSTSVLSYASDAYCDIVKFAVGCKRRIIACSNFICLYFRAIQSKFRLNTIWSIKTFHIWPNSIIQSKFMEPTFSDFFACIEAHANRRNAQQRREDRGRWVSSLFLCLEQHPMLLLLFICSLQCLCWTAHLICTRDARCCSQPWRRNWTLALYAFRQ